MSIFGAIKGYFWGKKTAATSIEITTSIINYIITNCSIRVMTHDTAHILRETFLHSFMIASLAKRNVSVEEFGSANGIAIFHLREWLYDNIKYSGANTLKKEDLALYFEEYKAAYTNLSNKLAEEKKELIGKSILEWAPAICSHYLIEIQYYLIDKYGEEAIPQNLNKYLFSLLPEFLNLVPRRMKLAFADQDWESEV